MLVNQGMVVVGLRLEFEDRFESAQKVIKIPQLQYAESVFPVLFVSLMRCKYDFPCDVEGLYCFHGD
jgi:hypothetical protein